MFMNQAWIGQEFFRRGTALLAQTASVTYRMKIDVGEVVESDKGSV
jgi:hypothetical protein